jgi:glutathione S-transferase
MKLLISLTSPFARKARVTLIEKGLADQIASEVVNPWQSPAALTAANPLSQVPTLMLDDGSAFYDSRVICAFLDTLAVSPQLVPSGPAARIAALRMEALADGMTDAAVMVRMARVAAPGEPDNPPIARQLGKVEACLAAMELDATGFGTDLSLAQIAFACALGYLDFRFPAMGWRDRAPQLAAWYAGFAERASMKATAPRE